MRVLIVFAIALVLISDLTLACAKPAPAANPAPAAAATQIKMAGGPAEEVKNAYPDLVTAEIVGISSTKETVLVKVTNVSGRILGDSIRQYGPIDNIKLWVHWYGANDEKLCSKSEVVVISGTGVAMRIGESKTYPISCNYPDIGKSDSYVALIN